MSSTTYELLSTINSKEKKNIPEIREVIETNNNKETSTMKKMRNDILLKLNSEDLYLIDYIINKIWFNVSYSEDIESKINKYLVTKI